MSAGSKQTQAKQNNKTQVLDDTRDFVGLAPGTDTATTEVSLDQWKVKATISDEWNKPLYLT